MRAVSGRQELYIWGPCCIRPAAPGAAQAAASRREFARIFHSAAKAASNLSVGRCCRAAQISGRSSPQSPRASVCPIICSLVHRLSSSVCSLALPSYEICGLMIGVCRSGVAVAFRFRIVSCYSSLCLRFVVMPGPAGVRGAGSAMDARPPMAVAVEVKIYHGVVKRVSAWLKRQAADDGDAQRAAQLRAGSRSQHQGHRAQHGGHGGHQDGPETQQAGLEDGLLAGFCLPRARRRAQSQSSGFRSS